MRCSQPYENWLLLSIGLSLWTFCSCYHSTFHHCTGKFGAVFASIPAPIIAALYCLFFAYVGTSPWFNRLKSRHVDIWFIFIVLSYSYFACAGAGGLSFLQFCNLNSFRTKFILGFSIFMGLSVPQYFNEYTAINGYGPVHTSGRWVCMTCQPWIYPDPIKLLL